MPLKRIDSWSRHTGEHLRNLFTITEESLVSLDNHRRFWLSLTLFLDAFVPRGCELSLMVPCTLCVFATMCYHPLPSDFTFQSAVESKKEPLLRPPLPLLRVRARGGRAQPQIATVKFGLYGMERSNGAAAAAAIMSTARRRATWCRSPHLSGISPRSGRPGAIAPKRADVVAVDIASAGQSTGGLWSRTLFGP